MNDTNPARSEQQDLFIDGIPEVVRGHGLSAIHPYPLVSRGKGGGQFSSRRVPRARAWQFPELQIPHAGSVYGALALDIDRRQPAQDAILAGAVPIPNWQVIRKSNGHRHVVYALADPVHRYDHARRGPLEYLAWVEAYYIAVLGADPGYNGILSHNPYLAAYAPESPYMTRWGRRQPFTLDELAEVIPIGWTPPKPRPGPIGRNVDLFNGLMQWAGRAENRGLCVHTAAVVLNQGFADPLPGTEVQATARSVEGYRRKWIAHGWHSPRFRARQSARGRASGQARRTASFIRSVPILGDHLTGMDNRTIARRHGVTARTVRDTVRRGNEPTQIRGRSIRSVRDVEGLAVMALLALAWAGGRALEESLNHETEG